MPGYFLLVEVVLFAVLGPELCTIPCYQCSTNEIKVVGNFHRLHKDFLDRPGIISPEVRNGVVIRMKAAQEPHHFNVSFALFLKSA